ncbi:efflux RND transporter permease subunit [Roseicyclus sp.]|uniref:efflux RND transporter permease subunit n=1 Tax=Roseicyclus sp. TaxID=1914329 RepID=UPI003FA02ADE
MKGLIDAVLRNLVLPNLILAGLVLSGLFAMTNLTVKNFPDISTGAVSITIAYPGATPQEVSDGVVQPVENAIRAIEGIRRIEARATQGLASITVSTLRSADAGAVQEDMETAVDGIAILPDAAETPTITEVTPQELAIQYVLTGDIDRALLKDVAQAARQDLLALEGVSTVEVAGVPEDQIGIEIRQETLRAYGLGLDTVAERIRAENLDRSGGVLQSGNARIQVRTLGEETTGTALADLPVIRGENGASVRLGRIATIEDGLAEEPVIALLDGRPAVFLSVFRAGEEQLLDLVETAQRYVEDRLRPRLPPAIEVVQWTNEAENLEGRIRLLAKNAAIGAGLILLLLTLSLDLRIAAWVSAGIVVAFVGSFGPMLAFGITVNQLSLFGFILALGIVVDDAIVVGERVYTERERRGDPREAARAGATAMARPVFFAVATTVAAFVPLLFLPGVSGSFITPVAAVVIIVLTMSLIESFFVLPQHLAHLRMGPPRRFSPRRATERLRGYTGRAIDRFADGPMRRIAGFSARRPVFTICLCLGILAASFSAMTSGLVRFVFFPDIEGNTAEARLVLPAGTALPRTRAEAERIAEAAGRAAARVAERTEGVEAGDVLRNTAISIGFTAASGGPAGGGGGAANEAVVEVRIADAETRAFSAERFAEDWRRETGEIPGARELVFSSSIVGPGAPISLQISAADPQARMAAVARIREALAGRSGVYGIRDSDATAAEEIVVRLRDDGAALGVSLAEVAGAVRAATFGEVAGEILRGDEEVELRVRLPEDQRESLADLQQYRIPAGDAFVPIGAVADLTRQPAPTTITRLDARRVTSVEADVDAAVTSGGAETAWLRENVLPGIREEHPSVEVRYGGEQDERARFGPALAQNFALALFGIYALLALAFGSWTRPVLILLTVPFALVGALAGHALLGLNLTLLSMFGIIGLTGILINASLLLLNEYGALRAEGRDWREAIPEAAARRFRPIFLTTLTTFLGVSPLLLETSLQAQFLIPTAVSLGFGILVGSILVLLVVPAYAALAARAGDWAARRSAEDAGARAQGA